MLSTMHEMGFIKEMDRAISRAMMAEFVRLQLIVGDDLNNSLQALHANLEATANNLIRDMDFATPNSTDLPSENPAVGAALSKFKELVKLKLGLLLAQLEAACEAMNQFLYQCLRDLDSQTEMANLIGSLSQRMADHESWICEIMLSEPLKHPEVFQGVIMWMAADQPMESNFFPGILEGLLGRLGIAKPGEMNPPASSEEGVTRLWATVVQDAVQKTEK